MTISFLIMVYAARHITWWERNQTAEEPVIIVSTDNGATFRLILKLATNGTIRETAEEG